ncbi:MAG: ferritin [Anaerolineales bacterium]|nr:ferritin [Anaerolineales bacterium]
MLISSELEAGINAQIGREFGASLQYYNLAAYFDTDDLPQLAAFFYRQAEEEKMHAVKFLHYIVDARGTVRIPAVDGPVFEIPSAEAAVQMALDWEVEVTNQINALMELAESQSDYIATEFLGWFVTEQLEEVSTMSRLLKIVQRAGDNLLLVEDFMARESFGIAEQAAE